MTAGSPFDPLVDAYDAARPGYPDDLYTAVEDRAGGFSGARVIDLGAGTGIATRALRERGARVVAVDIGPAMLARLRLRSPDVPAVLARAEALPFTGASADLVTAAQAWHWVDVARAAADVRRVLRPGGSLAVWWNNVAADGQPWFEAQQRRIAAMNPGYRREYRRRDYAAELSGDFPSVASWHTRWARRMPVADYLVWLQSKSYVAAIGDGLPAFLAEEEESLQAAFPDGVVVEPFEVELLVATTT